MKSVLMQESNHVLSRDSLIFFPFLICKITYYLVTSTHMYYVAVYGKLIFLCLALER